MFKKHVSFQSFGLRFILLVIGIVLSALVIFFNSEQLTCNPFDNEIRLDEPTSAVENTSGIKAVLDSGGTRVLLLSPENTITETITYSSTSQYTPSSADDLVMTETQLFILDHTTGANGTTLEGDRVLVYDLQGNFQDILIDSEALFSEEHQWRIYTLAADGARIYATFYDEMDPAVLVTADIIQGDLNILHTFDTGGLNFYDAFYSPEQDCTTAVAYNGTIACWNQDNLTLVEGQNYGFFADDIRMTAGGTCIALDQNAKRILQIIPGENSGKFLAETSAVNFSLCGNILTYTDPVTYTYHRLDMNTGEEISAGAFTLSQSIKITSFLTWGCVVFGAGCIILLILQILLPWIAKKKATAQTSSAEAESEQYRVEKPLTTARLYGPLFLTFIFIFSVSAFVFGNFYYEKEMNNRVTGVMNAGYTLREISGKTGLGDAIESIKSQADYDSAAYQQIIDTTDAVLMSGLDAEGSLNLPYQIYRFVDDSGDLMVVADKTESQRIGLILTEKDQEIYGLLEPAAAAKEGEVLVGAGMYNNGIERYMIYEPVYNASGEVAGLAVAILNLTLASDQIMDGLIEQLVTLFTLLAGLLMIGAELKYFIKVCRLKGRLRRQGIVKKTIVEADRTLKILFRLPSYVFLIFSTLITSDILTYNGISNPLLLALPLTIDSIGYMFMRSFAGPVVKYKPKAYLFAGNAGYVISFILIGGAVLLKSYILMVTAGTLFGLSNGVIYAATKTVYYNGIKPHPGFSTLLATQTESVIASAIGASIGSVLRSIWGDVALIIYVLVICGLHVLVVLNFVYDDINASGKTGREAVEKPEKKTVLQRLKSSASFYVRPNIIAMLIAAIIPVYILDAMSSYVMPLFNKQAGLSDVYIGLITFIITMISLFLVPKILDLINSGKRSDSFWIFVLMAGLAVTFALFAMNTEMKTMVLVLIGCSTLHTVFNAMSIRMNMRESVRAGLNPNDTDVIFEIAGTGAATFNNIILGLMITGGYSAFGWIWCGICAACAVLSGILNIIK